METINDVKTGYHLNTNPAAALENFSRNKHVLRLKFTIKNDNDESALTVSDKS